MERKLVTRKHLGHLFIDGIQQNPDGIGQIDAATGEEETRLSVLKRSVRLAKCFQKFGLKPGDVLSLGGRNHLDLHIPYYAALLTGLPISGVDPYFKFDEIKSVLTITKPRIAFCQQESYDCYIRALEDLGLDTKVITFDGKDNNLKQFIETYNEDDSYTEYEPVDFDSSLFAYLISTSGTTGGLKMAAFTHETVMGKLDVFKSFMTVKPNTESTVIVNLSPVQWVSGIVNALTMPIFNQTKLQTSKPDDEGHIIEMINKYKPVYWMIGPSLLATLLDRKQEVDLTCFRTFTLGGSKVFPEAIEQLRELLHKDARVIEAYGQTETMGPVTIFVPGTPTGSCGISLPQYEVKLVDPDTKKEVTEPHVKGELWMKRPGFTEYYNDPQATAAAFTKDGYFRSGDLFYRDENNFYYFVDRVKSLIKYRNAHVLPAELEEIIFTHPSVREVCVCGVPHARDGEHATACIQLKDGCRATEQEIKDLVASKLSSNKQLRGGVLFVDEMPMTSSGKIARGKVLALLKKSLQR